MEDYRHGNLEVINPDKPVDCSQADPAEADPRCDVVIPREHLHSYDLTTRKRMTV